MKIHQTSSKISDNRWKWSISLQASQEELDSVEKVIYHLHPTFPNPVVERTNRSDNFELKSSGWGTFVVRIEVHFKDKHTEELRHRLVFKRDKPKLFLSHSASEDDALLVTIKEEADRLGWEVSTANDISPGEDWEYGINQQIDNSELFVLLSGETPSRFAMHEFQTAKQLGKPTLVMDSHDHYGLNDIQKVTNSDELVNAFKAINFELKGL